MALVVNTNMASINAQRNLGAHNSRLTKSLERLSSGLRINKASDDAAGIAIATKFGSQVRGLNQAVRNANNAITLTQTAEGGLNTMTDMLQRLRELAIQSSSDDNTQSDRANLVNEANNLTAELTRMVTTTEYNTQTLLDGSFTSKNFQVGANYAQRVAFTISDARTKTLGGRAEYSADIADGVVNATDANFGQSEVKIDGYGVAATASADDQYSVLSVATGVVSVNDLSTAGGSIQLAINGTSMLINGIAAADVSTTAADSFTAIIVSTINAADVTNVTARQGTGSNNSSWTLEATGGTDITLAVSDLATTGSHVSALGMQAVSTMVGSTVATAVTNYNGQSSAVAKAAAINTIKNDSGVTATATSNTVTGGTAIAAATITSGDVYINGVNIGAVTVTASDGTGALVTAINNQSSSTGVTADTNADGKLVLTATDGRNITVEADDTFSDALLGDTMSGVYFTNNSAVFRSSVQLNDDEAFTLSGNLEDLADNGTTDALNMVKSTATSSSVATSVATYNIAAVSIDSQENSQAAILTIDAAMDDINGIRAEIGAIQNRLGFTVANLEIASENMSSSQSRIMDADFASETALFTRNQIMVQAATAILSQANTLPQLALQLLG